jgi:hypothetical protein
MPRRAACAGKPQPSLAPWLVSPMGCRFFRSDMVKASLSILIYFGFSLQMWLDLPLAQGPLAAFARLTGIQHRCSTRQIHP